MSKDYIKNLEKNVAFLEKENSKLIKKLKEQHIQNDVYFVEMFKEIFKDSDCEYEIKCVNDSIIECYFSAEKITCTSKFLKFLYKMDLVKKDPKFNGIIDVRIGDKVIAAVDCFDDKSIMETK